MEVIALGAERGETSSVLSCHALPCFLLEIVYTFLSAAAAATEALCRPVDRMRLRVAFRYRHSLFLQLSQWREQQDECADAAPRPFA